MKYNSWCAAGLLATLAFASVDSARAIDPVNNPQSATLNPSGSASGSSIPVRPISTTPTSPIGATTPSSINPALVNPSIITSPVPQPGVTDPGRTRIAPGTQIPSTGTTVNPLISPTPGIPLNPQQRRNRWRLGVYSTDTDAGVKIVEVVPNSPAQRVGLEPNDTIVTVNGYQVGFVNGEHFDTGSEFDRLADDDGNVILLVRNQRNGQLVNVPIQLESRFSSLQGTIGYRDRGTALPQDAVCTIELREVSRPNAPPIALSSKTIAIRELPLPFRLEYDPADVVARRSYYLHATITSGNRQLYATQPHAYQVLNGTTPGNQQVRMVIDPVAATGTQVVSRDEQLEEILRLYQAYLQRDPRANEYEVLMSRMERGQSIRDVQLDLLSGNEYYYHCEADNRNFVNQLHQQFLNRPAQNAEMDYWLSRMDQHGGLRREVAREFLQAVGAPQS